MARTVTGKYREFGLLVLRAGVGGMFVYHGLPKILGGPALWEKLGTAMAHVGIGFMPVLWGFMAAVAETVGGACLVLGVFFRVACVILLVTMSVAAAMHIGKGEGLKAASHAMEAGIVFFSLLLTGPGKYSIGKNK